VTRLLLRDARLLTPAGFVRGDLLTDQGRIVALGPALDVPSDGVDRCLELGGRWLTPAFVDAHAHLAATGFAALGADLSGAKSSEEALHTLAEHSAGSPLPVVLGNGWDETGWPEGDGLTRAAVDEACGHRPAYVARVDVHSAVASTALLDGLPDLRRTPGWDEAGPLTRDAHHALRDAVQDLLGAHRAAAVAAALQRAAEQGIGLVHELGAPHLSRDDDLDAAAALAGRAPDVVGYWGSTDLAVALDRGLPGAAGDLCVDGAIGSRTAALVSSYADHPTSGFLYLGTEEIAAHVVACTEAGIQAGFHVIGDRAVAAVVEGLERAAERTGVDDLRAARHRLEHLEMVSTEQVERLAALGVVASVQPAFDAWWGGNGGLYETRLGARAHRMNPLAPMRAAGLVLAFGSDTPVTPFDPWGAVRAARTTHRPEHRLGFLDAVAAHTEAGWTACRREGGRLETGAPAHLAVWETRNDAEPDPDHPSPTCALTVVGGRVVHNTLDTLDTLDTLGGTT
jgi:predicted amidohydrolase YtcJ